jgi:3-dehydroquinate synthase
MAVARGTGLFAARVWGVCTSDLARNMSDTRLLGQRFRVRVPGGSDYQVDFRPGLMSEYGQLCRRLVPSPAGKVVVLTDQRVNRIYGAALRDCLLAAGVAADYLVVPPGERSKSLACFEHLLDELARLGMDRRGLLVNFGGGIISDLGGFVASAYMRGIAYANLPTTLIGQLDASVGGKVAVNSRHAKNMFGAFHHPTHVAGDPLLLTTISERDFRSGMAEAIKVAIIASPELFRTIEAEGKGLRSGNPTDLTWVIATAAELKMALIEPDPYEKDLRRPLNLGHTLGHPIETEFAYQRIRHGEAVAVGMAVATIMSLRKGVIQGAVAERIFRILEAFDLMGCAPPIHADAVIEHLRFVRLIRGNQLHFVLPEDIGRVRVTEEVSTRELLDAFHEYDEMCEARGLRKSG